VTELRAGSATHEGQVRSLNEDSKLVVEAATLFGVADGMGGHRGGEVASAMAVELVAEHAAEADLDRLVEAVRIANRAIFEKAGSDRDLHGMGTTLCAVQLVTGDEGDEVAWVNVGDSRVYLFRDDRLIQLSNDHSLVEDLVRDGQLTPEEAAVHPQRNIITRALGIDVDVNVDSGTVLPFTGDRFLVCSDGLFNEVSEDQISAVLRRLADPTEAADELVRLANEGGGRDNITVVLVDVVDDGGRAEAASAAMAAGLGGSGTDDTTIQSVTPPPAPTAPVEDGPVMAGRRSSLPDADAADYGSDADDLFGNLDQARSRRFTWRVVAFALALLLVLAVVVGAFYWSAHNTYFVGFEGKQVAIYQGRPGGFLGVEPELVDDGSGLERAELTQAMRAEIDAHKEFSSRADALRYLQRLTEQVEDRTTTTTTTTTSTTTSSTTTTVPVTAATTPPATAPTTTP
jgi:serine/threonine protein phosphatase PrpC